MLFDRYGSVLTDADRAAVFGAADLQTATYFAGRFGLPPERIQDLRDEYSRGRSASSSTGAWS